MITRALLILLFGVMAHALGAEEMTGIDVVEEVIVNQRDFPDSINGCGPASILNMLTFGKPELQAAGGKVMGQNDATRMRFIVDRYFQNRKSVVYPGRQRWGVHGVPSADLAVGVNELLEESGVAALKASYLNRKTGEENSKFQQRVYGWMERSIQNGVPPILSLRSYVVRQRENSDQPGWETPGQHFITLTGISKDAGDRTEGFSAMVIDSAGGKQTRIHLFVEPNGQPFRAMMGVIEENHWLDGQPFLLVIAPDIRGMKPADLKWSERFLIVADFLIGDF